MWWIKERERVYFVMVPGSEQAQYILPSGSSAVFPVDLVSVQTHHALNCKLYQSTKIVLGKEVNVKLERICRWMVEENYILCFCCQPKQLTAVYQEHFPTLSLVSMCIVTIFLFSRPSPRNVSFDFSILSTSIRCLGHIIIFHCLRRIYTF